MNFRFYNIINALSLDVALGAGILSLVLGRYMGIRVPVSILVALVLAVWIIYTIDHLLDARSIPHQAASFRHHFHQHFQKQIQVALAIAVISTIFIVIQLPPVTIFYGIPVALSVSIYFVLNRFFGMTFQKEILIAALYVIGVFIGPFSLITGGMLPEMSLLLIQLGIMAWANLIIFGIYEIHEDKKDNLSSTVTSLGEQTSGLMVKVLLSVSLVIGLTGLLLFNGMTGYLKLQLVFIFMTSTLGILFFRRETIARNGLQYRYFGDGIFFMPVAYFWF